MTPTLTPSLRIAPTLSPGTSASWTFLAEPVGTLWYHSHAEFQRDDGLSGALVVRDVRREEDTVCDLTEHVIHLQEWFDTPAEDRYRHFDILQG